MRPEVGCALLEAAVEEYAVLAEDRSGFGWALKDFPSLLRERQRVPDGPAHVAQLAERREPRGRRLPRPNGWEPMMARF